MPTFKVTRTDFSIHLKVEFFALKMSASIFSVINLHGKFLNVKRKYSKENIQQQVEGNFLIFLVQVGMPFDATFKCN